MNAQTSEGVKGVGSGTFAVSFLSSYEKRIHKSEVDKRSGKLKMRIGLVYMSVRVLIWLSRRNVDSGH
jgi:hypothetical protein